METNSYIEPVFLISAVAEILDIHPQTLRQYEREGLITPSRTNGKIRLYSQKDIDHIKYVLTFGQAIMNYNWQKNQYLSRQLKTIDITIYLNILNKNDDILAN